MEAAGGAGEGGEDGVVGDGVALVHFVEQVEGGLELASGGAAGEKEVVGGGGTEVRRGGVEGGDRFGEAVVPEVAGDCCVELGGREESTRHWECELRKSVEENKNIMHREG